MGGTTGGYRLKYIHKTKPKRGGVYYYYRRNGTEQRIKGAPGSHEFLENYNAIHASFEDPGKAPAMYGTFAKLIEEYKQDADFQKLADRTKKEDRRYFKMIEKALGDMAVSKLTTPDVIDIRKRLKDTPRKADYYITVLKKLLKYSIQLGYRETNPADVVGKISDSTSYRPWEDFELDTFRETWPPNTVQRIAFEIALNTGQRGGDVIDMTRADYKNGWIKVVQNKTSVKLEIPVSDALRDVLDPWLATHKHMMLITNSNGEQFKKRNFENVMRKAYTDCGLGADISTHGLRYTAATVMYEIGVEKDDIAAITGHQTLAMLEKYIEQKRRARRAVTRLDENAR
jgi:integrase